MFKVFLLLILVPALGAESPNGELLAEASPLPAVTETIPLAVEETFEELLQQESSLLASLSEAKKNSEKRAELRAKINALGKKKLIPALGLGHTLRETEVMPSETLSKIARRCQCSLELLLSLNQLPNPDRLYPKMKLYAPSGSAKIVVDKAKFELYLYISENLISIYPVGLGARGSDTPLGATTLSSSRAKFPSYTDKATKKTYPYGDPLNPVGSRWMGLNIGRSYGIHGTNDETSVGRARSHGCIRMKREDLEELFDKVCIGDSVIIR